MMAHTKNPPTAKKKAVVANPAAKIHTPPRNSQKSKYSLGFFIIN